MDALSHFLSLYQPRGSLDVRCNLSAPWELEHQPEAAGIVPYHVIVEGSARLDMAGRPTVLLAAGDIVAFPRGSAHRLRAGADADAGAPCAVCVREADMPVRFKTNAGAGARSDILCGRFEFADAAGAALLSAFPDLLLVRSAANPEFSGLRALTAMLRFETGAKRPGAAMLVSQLSSVLFGLLIRAWTEQSGTFGGLLGALSERRLQAALLGMFADPGRPWTLDDMARACHMSRATFVRLFQQATGATAAATLLQIRMAQAAQWIARGGRSLAAIGEAVGYRSEAAFSRAFKKCFGVAPGQYRRGMEASA